MDGITGDVAIGGVLFPSLLLAAILGTIAAYATVGLLNRFRLSRFFFYPPIVFISVAVIYTRLFNKYLFHQ